MRLIVIVFLTIMSLAQFASAQVDSAQVDNTMREIYERMEQIEQDLARASQEPSAVDQIIESLGNLAEGDLTALTPEIREMLLNNPELLARLSDPEAGEEEMSLIEDDIRRLLYSEEDGLDQLLENNPEIMERLIEEPETLENLIREFVGAEDDLAGLFSDVEQQMAQTESDIVRLIELVGEAEQSMAAAQAQSQNEGDSAPSMGQVPPRAPQGTDAQSEEYDPDAAPEPESSGARTNEDDPNAWTADLPGRAQQAARDASVGERPDGWEGEMSEFYRLLSQAATRAAEERRIRGSDD